MGDEIDFYATYNDFKSYETPVLKRKHIRQFDREFWRPAACSADMAVLEIGCGAGLFLCYLKEKGVTEALGIDQNPELIHHLPPAVTDNFVNADVWQFVADGAGGRRFHRIAMFDVLEHFTPDEGVRLLRGLNSILAPGGRVVARVPNVASPWGVQVQFGDLTHKTPFTPGSMRQLALAAGFTCTACLPQVRGHWSRRATDRLLHGLLSRLLITAPEVWTANMVAVLEPRST